MASLGDAFMQRRVSLRCPKCGKGLKATLDDVRAARSVQCPCGATVKLRAESGSLDKLRRAMNEFERAMRRAGFRIRYRR